jgi:phage terminase large subunit GpA-like protein
MNIDYTKSVESLFDSALFELSTIKPSDWGEQNRVMTSDISPIPGKLSYKNSPYTREIVDCLAPDHPSKVIAIMKGAQIGFSTTVIETGIGWIISQNPGNIMFNVGHDELVEEAITKVDRMIDSCNLRHYIRPNVNRAKNMKTGDTNRRKEFAGGYLVAGVPNHKLYRNRSIQYGFIDDFEAAKGNTKQAGATTEMIEQRFAAYKHKMKLFYISTPELKRGSNIEPVYLLGDQRKYFIPCPCCGEFIDLHWKIQCEIKEDLMGGITWSLNSNNELIIGSVGYICQKCGEFFNDANKDELLRLGEWRPTAKASRPGYYSYHISSLYAPTYMFDWEDYVRKYLLACPPGENVNQNLYKTFVNLCLGETYEEIAADNKASQIQSNTRNYNIGVVPESLSIKDGNGRIVILTLSADLNGKVDDARLDYEVCAWSETGASYSVVQGSIGTFVPRENTIKFKQDREPWSYQLGVERSVWKELNKIIDSVFTTDTGRKMKIAITGVDTSFTFNGHAYEGVDTLNGIVVKLKGKDVNIYSKIGKDMKTFQIGKERPNLFLVEVNYLKDLLSERMKLMWDEGNDSQQPSGYMNFPIPSDGKYLYKNYFEHFEAEHRITKSDSEGNYVGMRWEKKTSTSQNHFYDVHVYAMALKDIIVYLVQKQAKITKPLDWSDFVEMILPKGK